MQSGTANARENERRVRFSKTWHREALPRTGQQHFIVDIGEFRSISHFLQSSNLPALPFKKR
ncbi:MAG: hypothetical protein DMG82_02815 [Acidobacteria bacterium]|nr:MAG: hypothetical protein DMG82_02815 [Acidobacteriota bacterium]PYX43370.1 MAG: hypothetical protein DMG83_17530 [Acidobacteriota bacterium]